MTFPDYCTWLKHKLNTRLFTRLFQNPEKRAVLASHRDLIRWRMVPEAMADGKVDAFPIFGPKLDTCATQEVYDVVEVSFLKGDLGYRYRYVPLACCFESSWLRRRGACSDASHNHCHEKCDLLHFHIVPNKDYTALTVRLNSIIE